MRVPVFAASVFTIATVASPGALGASKAAHPRVPPAPAASVKLPTAASMSCSQERHLRSLNSNVAVWMRFKNQTSSPVAMYWLNFRGARVFYQYMQPRTIWLEQTYATHPWVVTSLVNHRCMEIFVAGRKSSEANIR